MKQENLGAIDILATCLVNELNFGFEGCSHVAKHTALKNIKSLLIDFAAEVIRLAAPEKKKLK